MSKKRPAPANRAGTKGPTPSHRKPFEMRKLILLTGVSMMLTSWWLGFSDPVNSPAWVAFLGFTGLLSTLLSFAPRAKPKPIDLEPLTWQSFVFAYGKMVNMAILFFLFAVVGLAAAWFFLSV